MSRRAAALLAIALMTLTVLSGAVPAESQEPDAPAHVVLSAIDPVAVPGTPVRFAVTIEHRGTSDEAWTDVRVVADLHAALGNRSALRAALDGGTVPRRVLRATVGDPAAPPLGPGGILRIAGELPMDVGALAGPDSAVHALRLRVVADGREVGRLDTAIVRVGSAPAVPIATTLVWPVHAPPTRDPGGDPTPVLDPLTVAGGRIDTLLAALEPVPTFAPGIAMTAPAHLLEDLAQRSASDALATPEGADPVEVPAGADPGAVRAEALLRRLRGTVLALPTAPLITPYADADVVRLLASDASMRTLASRALVEGAARPTALVGRVPAPVVLLDAPVTAAVLDLVPSRTIVMPYVAIEGPDLALDIPLDDPVRTLRSPTGRPVTALVGDPYLATALGASTRRSPGDPVRAAQEVLVRTAMVHLEAPGRPGRSLVLLPPERFDPDPRFAAELLARLGSAPWLMPTAPDVLATASASAGAPVPARLAELRVAPVPDRLAVALDRTARDLELLVGAVDVTGVDADLGIRVGGRALRDASDELLRATSARLGIEAALALLGGVRSGVDTAFGTSSIAIDDVTLTDRDGTVPLSVTHTGPVPLQVRVDVSGPAALTWTDGRSRALTFAADATSPQSLEIAVRSGATGRFPVRVRVTDPTGERLLASEVTGVRATALATPALAVIAIAVVLLTAVGAVRQHRRGLRLPGRDIPETVR